MLYRRFPGCRKRRSAHTTSHGRCQGAQRVAGPPPCRATFGTSRLPSLPLSRRRVLFAAVPTRPRWFRMDIESTKRALCTQSGGGINRQPWTPGGICSGPYPLTSLQSAAGRTRCYTVRGLCISTLHVSLIIRVLPRAESATGCIFRQRDSALAPFMSKAGISEAFAVRCVEATRGQRYCEKNRVSRGNTALVVFFRSSLHGAGGDSRQFGKLAKTP